MLTAIPKATPAATAQPRTTSRYTLSSANITKTGSVLPWKPETTNSTGLQTTRMAAIAASLTGRTSRTSSNTSSAVPKSARQAGTRMRNGRLPMP